MRSFCTAKASHNVWQKMAVFFSYNQIIIKFNISFTNDTLSFEQLDPALDKKILNLISDDFGILLPHIKRVTAVFTIKNSSDSVKF